MEQLEKTDLIKKLSALQEFIAEMKLDGMYFHSTHYRDDRIGRSVHCGIWEKNLKQQKDWCYITEGVKFSHHETPSSPALYIVIFGGRSFSNLDATATEVLLSS